MLIQSQKSTFLILWLADNRVDTHIDRVSNRTKFAMGKNVDLVEKKLLKVVPAEFKVDVHHWLIIHGRYTCIARKPRCGSCIVEDLCEFKDKTSDECSP